MEPTTGEMGSTLSSVSDFVRDRRASFLRPLESLLVSFSPFERLLLYAASMVLAASTLAMLAYINVESMVEVPSQGGSLTEGMVGTPRFVNPLLATTDTDKDVVTLVYSGLMRAENGTLIPDLASGYDIDESGTGYTFYIRPDATFHDGTPLTAYDVQFTVTIAQNPQYKSVKRTEWDGVTIEVIDDYTIHFQLPHAYSPFLEATTLGILPRALWENIDPNDFAFHQLNTHPIGSGPYRIANITEDSSGAVSRYTLRPFSNFTLGTPLLQTITLKMYPSTEDALKALESGAINALGGITAADLGTLTPGDETRILKEPLPRVFAIFFNQSKNDILTELDVREALSLAVNRDALVTEVLGGLGQPLFGPVPTHILNVTESARERGGFDPDRAATLLSGAGWKLNEETGVRENSKGRTLAVSIATADTPELVAAAEFVARAWRAVGVEVTVKVFSGGDLNNTVIRPREYDALLFGQVVGRAADVYAFWHSSQRNDPGLNLALYTNADADTLLNEARRETDPEARVELLLSFAETVEKDVPAVFLFAPEYVYLVPTNVSGISLGTLTNAAERFASVYKWHRETEYVWDIFVQK